MKPPLRGYVIVLGGTIIWAWSGIVTKILLTWYTIAPVTIAVWRVIIITGFMLALLSILDAHTLRFSSRDWRLFLAYGIVGIGIHQLVWIGSVQYNGAAVATVILYTGPALVTIIAARFLRERITRLKVLALISTLIGCALVARVYDTQQIRVNALGILAGLGSACTFATYSLLGRLATQRYSPWTALFYAFLFGTLFLLPLACMRGEVIPHQLTLDGWGWIVFLALVPTLGGFASYTLGLSYLPASIASILAAFEPVTAAILAFWIFGEVLEPLQVVGAGLILTSVVLLRPRH